MISIISFLYLLSVFFFFQLDEWFYKASSSYIFNLIADYQQLEELARIKDSITELGYRCNNIYFTSTEKTIPRAVLVSKKNSLYKLSLSTDYSKLDTLYKYIQKEYNEVIVFESGERLVISEDIKHK